MEAILDSSALIALINADDALHDNALQVRAVANAAGYELLLPYEVLAETLNVFGRSMDKAYAVRAGETLLALHRDGELQLVKSTPLTVTRALALLATGKGGPSFVDALVMSCGDAYGTQYVFGFDATFRKNGYRLPGAAGSMRSAA